MYLQSLVQELQLGVQVDRATPELEQEHEIYASSSSFCSEPELEPQPLEENSQAELSEQMPEETSPVRSLELRPVENSREPEKVEI